MFYSIAFAIEFVVLYLQGTPAHMEFFVTGFSLTGNVVKQTGIGFVLMCIGFIIINVWMEEGLFRGFYLTYLSTEHTEKTAMYLSAILFGIWHLVLPLRSLLDGGLRRSSRVPVEGSEDGHLLLCRYGMGMQRGVCAFSMGERRILVTPAECDAPDRDGISGDISLASLVFVAIGTALLPKAVFGLFERLSTFSAVVFNAVLGVFLMRGQFEKQKVRQ